jgi:alpha-tubulin suppressor-like RCC1 family protein
LTNVVAIAAGGATSLALLTNGTMWDWGSNIAGELGIGTISTTGCACISHPVRVIRVTGAVAIATGGSHSLAIVPLGAGGAG